jgi:cell division protein FtsI/penicillin-binding protein 2
MEVAGKTGSTEHGHGKTTHAWFVGFAPANAPKIAVCVLLEDAGHGGEVAAPVAAEVIKKYLSSLKGANGPEGSAIVPGP